MRTERRNILTDTGFPRLMPGKRSQSSRAYLSMAPRGQLVASLALLKEFESVKSACCGFVRACNRPRTALEACGRPQGHEIVSHGWRWIY